MSAWFYPTAGGAYVGAFGTLSTPAATLGAWQQRIATGRYRTSGGYALQLYGNAAGSAFYVDDASCVTLTTADLFATLDTAVSDDFTVSAALTATRGQPAGLVICLDSAATPASYVLVYHNGYDTLTAEKLVAGTRTQLFAVVTGVTYYAGARLAVSKSGSSFKFYYNGALVSTQTIADAQIVGNTRHGLFASANTASSKTSASPRRYPKRSASSAIQHQRRPRHRTRRLDLPACALGPDRGREPQESRRQRRRPSCTHMDAQVTASAATPPISS